MTHRDLVTRDPVLGDVSDAWIERAMQQAIVADYRRIIQAEDALANPAADDETARRLEKELIR